jgi:LmbE family N-acetylglucosaminyl deacetylase
MYQPILNSCSRVMMFAPHPDDESLAAGIFLQRAAAAGAAIRIVYATDGEKNCWPQRVLERKVRIRARDRSRWGERRRGEAFEALRTLNIASPDLEFLALPDQGITNLLLDRCRETIRLLAGAVTNWQPTHLLIPSTSDTHSDHSALGVLIRLALDNFLPWHHGILPVHYLVHGGSESFARAACDLWQSAIERKTKRRAIVCHISQMALSRRRFLAYAKRPERFVFGEENLALGDGPIRSVRRDTRELCLQVAFALKPLRAEETSLYLVGQDAFGGVRTLRTTLPGRSTAIDLIDCTNGAFTGVGHYRGDAFHAEISLPLSGFASSHSVYVKLDRRGWFFDEAGWLKINAVSNAAGSRPRPLNLPELAVA